MEYKVNFQNDTTLRNSFHALTQKVFHFQLGDWYENGYWSESYEPHSMIDGNTVVANISVNHMTTTLDGVKKHFLQLGTVMTDPAYRNQGLSRQLMVSILEKYLGKVDGIYLFANDSVLEFYPKFGFTKSNEYVYRYHVNSSELKNNLDCKDFEPQKVDITDPNQREFLIEAAKQSVPNEAFSMDNFGLMAFCLTGPYSNNIYYLPKLDAYIVATIHEKILFLQQIIASKIIEPKDIALFYSDKIETIELGFTPFHTSLYEVSTYHEEDSTLFILGEELLAIERLKLHFQDLSHA
ncbi:GNAT family N-acetyltransferase [Lachnoclostridium phytofermentans]|uniref:GCN5-related N-acetyltransferase n=1 Tax=Lachnoclostridium phytofermentans (strain ATCC 700394 / DSM 18823 / ISDg) TaxID=357809 RepID=A9KR78_LACP7|nr:GNAT family N-acetyltransferase [Lachnoclostridium phytofermentans]ABX40546.1 GCN5-related N-acetyltransferase [Lachnoclostridium phytofermentans ISDg]